ncbi:MAG: hypothetical protein P0Y62_11475 [Candidatus Chryseobacterium colombiense]|nr:hypothetical protein [Chryseobacterium sp.]WEK68480.1 MAG: hypothetical protein P0Y62_11475 [Chryseobacterium sp.]
MMLAEHKKEVRDYLLSRKLSLDILIEVEDHFLNQIENIQAEEHKSFDVAFEDVKIIWKEDLKPAKNYNGNEIPLLARKIKNRKINKILFKSLILVLIIILGVFLLSKLTVKQDFKEIMTYLFFIILGIPGIYYLCNLRWFNLTTRNKSVKINIYQSANIIAFLPGLIMMGGSSFSKMAVNIYDFINADSKIGLMSFIVLACFLWFFSFGFLLQIAFIQSMKKMKPYLSTFNLNI